MKPLLFKDQLSLRHNVFNLDVSLLCCLTCCRKREPRADAGGSQVQRVVMRFLNAAVMAVRLHAALGTAAMLCLGCDHPGLHGESEALVVLISR